MKDAIILFLIILTAAATFFWGMTFLFKKSIQSTPKIERSDEYKHMMKDQRQRMNDLKDRQRQSMRDTQQRIKDLQRR